ncbi:MAG: hypothetical protein HY060_14215 [Proteobacteria bacterium]|nr:hypothetical protein [Pseudomonadota bacterium]
MKVLEQIPAMSDAELATLRSNAERLSKAGTTTQKAQAVSVLETVNAQIGQRNAAKREAMAERRAQAAADKPATPKKTRAKKVKADSASENVT